jgi:diguanylate cyclase (GGDEF)-like protein
MFSSLFSLLRRKTIVTTDKRYYVKAAIQHEVMRGASVVLFYVDIVKLTEIETRYGDNTAKRVLQIFEKTLLMVARQIFEIKGKLLGIQKLWGDDFAIYVSFGKGVNDEDCRLMSICFHDRVEALLNQQISFVNREDLRVHIGYAEIPGQDIVKEMYTSVKHAVHMAKYGITSEKFMFMTQFHRLLHNEEINMHYMSIVSLRDGEPLGWEALARGPENSPFYSPATLFSYAEETDNVFRLENICRKRAVEQLRYLKPNQKMFINLDPRAIDDPFLLRGNIFKLLEDYGLNPHNIVLEITERHAITNYAVFRKIIEEYRKKGYLIAVDDAGAGYSSLESIAEIYPDFIKLDMSLIRNIDADSIKQALLETFVQFAEKVKCKIIAEGIETEQELQTLIKLGVPYGQGYYLGKPARGMTKISGQAMNFIRLTQEQLRRNDQVERNYSPDVSDILSKTVYADKRTKVRKIHQIFEQNQRIDSIVILSENKPIGLVMRFQLYQVLGGQYGIALYYERPVSQIMNKNPLTVHKDDKIDEVAKRAMARDADQLYDVVIVTNDLGEYLGIVTVQSLLDKMATIKLEQATFANPLTGLPGNLQIERELMNRLKRDEEFMVVYCDLDRFKWFNDCYGFEAGDQIICRTAELLKESVKHRGNPSDFIGHIGGDDFIVITAAERVKAITTFIEESFTDYFADIYRRWSREGERFPALSLSMAGVYGSRRRFASVEEISQQAAYVKKMAKQLPGTVFVCDMQRHLEDAIACNQSE